MEFALSCSPALSRAACKSAWLSDAASVRWVLSAGKSTVGGTHQRMTVLLAVKEAVNLKGISCLFVLFGSMRL